MELEQLKKAYNLLSKEFSDNLNNYESWEMHQLILSLGLLKDLIKKMQEKDGLINANKIYKKVKEELK